MTSLRARLFVSLAVLLALTALVSGIALYSWAFDEAIEVQDGVLLQVGALLANNSIRAGPLPEHDVDPDARLSVAELDGKAGVGDRPLAALPPDAPDGFQTPALSGKVWRVLVNRRADGSRVAVGQPVDARNEIARGSALRATLPFAILIPCLMAMIALIIHTSFRPASRLIERLERDPAGMPALLPISAVPDEMRPFVLAINRLIERLTERLDRERRFIADAAHELRTPVAVLSVQAQNLENAASIEDRAVRTTELKTGIRRTARLLEQLLDHARFTEGALRSNKAVDLSEIAKSVAVDFLALAEERSIDLGFERLTSAPVAVDAAALAIVVRNLLANALRYSPNAGRVDISVSAQRAVAVLEIMDNGPGIPSADIVRVLDPFKRGASARGEGAGLGLAIVNRIVTGVGGTLTLENREHDRTGLVARATFPSANIRSVEES